MKKWCIFMFTFLLVTTSLVSASAASKDENSADAVSKDADSYYEIYPVPHKETDLNSDWTITDEVNVVLEEDIDEATINFLQQIMDSKSIKMETSDEIVPDKTNVIIGTKDSDGYVDRYMSDNSSYDEAIFDEVDPYVLTIDKEMEESGTVAILGDDTDAAYYALASLKMIFDQVSGNDVHSMMYEDYSDSKWRGFIEGFYGFPWSHESRISLMKYGGNLKMNSYIFGPKDDKYHNEEWRKLYPADELAKIEELASVGKETKTQFIWAIHPGFNMIDWDDYDNELDTLLAKLDQLYDAGVRQFGVFMDDIDTNQALEDRDKHVKLISDIADWVKDKEDVKSLVYTPPFYNQAWTGEEGKPYLEAMQDLPENVEIMWTGNDVIGTVNQEDMQWPKDLMGRDPFVWLNWPVNGYAGSRLLLGEGVHFLEKGTHNISGVVSNPLEQAELSKIALFAVNDFAWNVDDYNSKQSWEDSFKYITPNVAAEFRIIAQHLSDPSPNSRGVVLKESENIKEDLNEFTDRFDHEKSVDEIGESLITEFDQILDAITGFKEKSTNDQLLEEIDPWLNSLEEIVKADKHAVESGIALQQEDMNDAWSKLGKAADAMAESKTFKVEKLDEENVAAEAGTKRLVPFAEKLIDRLDANIYTSINPEAIITTPISSYDQQDLSNMVDGDETTYAYIRTIQEKADWYGVDLGKKVHLDDIHILQGRNDEDHDIFQKGMLEYSNDGENWEAIGNEQSGYLVEAEDLDIEARYLRYKLTHTGAPGGKPDLWTAIREFNVNTNKDTEGIYTNVKELENVDLQKTDNTLALEDMENIRLKPSEYIGMELEGLERIKDMTLESTGKDITLEVSENGLEWNEIDVNADSYPNATYVRLINKTEKASTFDLTKWRVVLQKFSDPVVTHNYQSVYEGELDSIYNGSLDSKVWFEGKQDEGNYVQVDMGGAVAVDNVAVAIDDGEGDYFREGELQLSLDGESWETVGTFDQPEDQSLNFPDHEAPYRYKRVQTDGEQARYVRLLSTADHNAWLALNEIIVNEGEKKPKNEDLAVQAKPQGKSGYEARLTNDQKLSTFYMPEEEQAKGNLTYKLTKETAIDHFIILQNPDAISNANVSIRDEDGWHQIGQLSESLNTLDTTEYDHVLEVKVAWDESIQPQIYEIIPVKRQDPVINKVEDMKELVEKFANNDAFADEASVQALQRHLTAVSQYEQQGKTAKLVKHMKGFETLLDDQKENELISNEAFESLYRVSDMFIENNE